MSAMPSLFASTRNKVILTVAAIAVIALCIFSPIVRILFGIVIPYAAIAIFVAGVVYRIVKWAKSPVPFRITTTCGQQKSLPWIKSNWLDNPHNTLGVIGRMALEVLCFRSLFRNTKTELRNGPRLSYGTNIYLWLGALTFHWCFLIIVIRHLRFFTDPIPFFVRITESLDGFFQIGVPLLYLTDLGIVAALSYLFLRRILDSKLRYISLIADYFPLLLILGIALTGIIMRYTPMRADIVGVKELAMGIISLQPTAPEGIGCIFYIHLFLVCTLIAYFPFSKLMHLVGIFLSPTRNLANDNRMRRHINPWDYPVNVHTYEEWEDEFRDKIKLAGLPLDKEE